MVYHSWEVLLLTLDIRHEFAVVSFKNFTEYILDLHVSPLCLVTKLGYICFYARVGVLCQGLAWCCMLLCFYVSDVTSLGLDWCHSRLLGLPEGIGQCTTHRAHVGTQWPVCQLQMHRELEHTGSVSVVWGSQAEPSGVTSQFPFVF